MKQQLLDQIQKALTALLDEAEFTGEAPEVVLESPRQAEHGDFACSLPMALAKPLRSAPRKIAEQLIAHLGDAGGLLARSEIAGPGFINMWLAEDRWRDVLREIIEAGPAYGHSDVGKGRRVQVEFVSANPTGPLSTGHGRQAILGDCIARLLDACGYAVTREYYFNDGGRQMRVLGESVKARYLELLGRAAPPPRDLAEGADYPEEIDGLPVVFPQDGYQGEYIGEIGRRLVEERGESLVDEPGDGFFREWAQAEIFAEIRATLSKLQIEFDVFFSERSLHDDGKLQHALDDLRERGFVYDADGAVWLRSTEFGLDRDRVLIKSSGEPTYLMPDIAYHREKFARGFELIIDVLGADHIEQFPFVRSAVAALGCDPERVQLVMHQFVTLTSGGEKVKQSTRRANFITIDELVEDVGVDVFRFFMIERRADGHLDFDLGLARDQNWRKNPAYYVQYAHARTYGIERKAAESGVAMPSATSFDAGRLELKEELELVKKLGELPDVIERAAQTREPHHIAYYLRDVAGLWNPYIQDGVRHRVLSDDESLTAARLGLTLGVRAVLASGLQLLGVSAPEQM